MLQEMFASCLLMKVLQKPERAVAVMGLVRAS